MAKKPNNVNPLNKEHNLLKNYKRRFRGRLRAAILKRDNYKCVNCGRTKSDGVSLEIDHIIEYENGGETSFENGQVLCKSCNIGKHHLKNYDQIYANKKLKKREQEGTILEPKLNLPGFEL